MKTKMKFIALITALVLTPIACSKPSLIGSSTGGTSGRSSSGGSGSSGGGGGGGGGGSALISWTSPTQNSDNSALNDLAGCKVYYGTTLGGPYGSSVSTTCTNGSSDSTTVSGLTSGTTYYFTVHAYDYTGNESVASSEVFKAIP